MKPHLVLKTSRSFNLPDIPFWGDVALGKAKADSSFSANVEQLFKEYHLNYVVTSEYPKKHTSWTEDEIKAELNRFYRFILLEEISIPSALLNRLELLPEIEHVQLGGITSTPLPELTMSLGKKDSYRYDHVRKSIGLDKVSRDTLGDPSVIVAVLDTGVQLKHPELQHCLLPGYDFVDIIAGANEFIGDFLGYDTDPDDEVGHGTHVAGIIGAKGIHMSPGVVPNCKILPVRVLGAMKRGDDRVGAGLIDNINSGIKWAVDQGAQVINMSLGIVHEGGGLPHEEVVKYARDKGVTIVAATGNDGQNAKYYPSSLPHVIGVGALDKEMIGAAAFSTFGDQVDFVAPGTDIFSTHIDGKYAFSSGTSHSTPFVTGAIALLKSYAKQKGKSLSDQQIKYILKHSSDKLGKSFKDLKAGYGMLNLEDALQMVKYKLNIN
ncbi:S8 family peptidase [Fluviicola sp.]|uniref:S8 family peptidase n=1 Tax=Fluviicola sp. TaxID=1917219 RepID=UPI003D291B9D